MLNGTAQTPISRMITSFIMREIDARRLALINQFPVRPVAPVTERTTTMDVTLHIPDELAQRLKAAGGDLSRRALEALALEEYKLGHLTAADLCGLLSLGTPADMDG